MPSTATTNLRLELQAPGENDDTWGTKLNTTLQLIEDALTRRTSLSLTNVDVTLSATNFATDQARSLCLVLTGTLTGNVNIIVPALSHLYLVQNDCTGAFTVTVKTSAGTGVVVTQGATTLLYCNATNVVAPTAAATDAQTLDGIDSTGFLRLASGGQIAAGVGNTFVTAADGATVTCTCTAGNRFITTIAGNRTLALASPLDGQTIELWVVQDATGGRTITFPANVLFTGGVAPSLTGSPNALDVFRLTYNLARDQWAADVIPSLAASTVGLVIEQNEGDLRVFERVGSPGAATTVNLTIRAGVVVYSTTTGSPALDLTGFASGSTINLVNLGVIVGKGGGGGDGGWGESINEPQVEDDRKRGEAGRAGGNAILGPGSGRTLNITNASGRIYGGGGGGGGGGATVNLGGNNLGVGGGGGGGAGGGFEGTGAGRTAAAASNGVPGSTGRNGAGGAGGAGANSGTATGGAGGAGGAYGAAGSAGASPTGSGSDSAGGAAGAAGKAVELNGGSANFISGSGSPNVEGAVS